MVLFGIGVKEILVNSVMGMKKISYFLNQIHYLKNFNNKLIYQ